MSDGDEAFLVRAAQRGDLDAFGDLVRRHELQVFRVALRMLGSQADAEDAAQEALVKAWRSIGRFRQGSAFGTWLYRIVTNHCLNVIAARRPTMPWDEQRDADAGADPASAVQRRAELAELTASISALPAEQRAALVLREFEGLSYEEVAEVLQISLAAVKGRIHRARLTVAQDLGDWR
ncbi:MAG: sigma-70 family RNA polymerase sigma factor [Solirubrobacteraceae bacterium]|nr:sigma-70 family RNA polymerase sigma factor [Solirubrobacteraceae bacterium]